MADETPFNSELWKSVPEACDITGYKPSTLRGLCIDEVIDCRKVGRDWLVNIDSLIAYKDQSNLRFPRISDEDD